MKVLVTGDAGFIGARLVRDLRTRGDDVIGLDRHSLASGAGGNHITCDLLDRDRLIAAVRQTAPTAIVHLAARTDLDERHDLSGYQVNIEGVTNLIAAIRATPSVRRCLLTSSQLVCRVGYQPRDALDCCPNTLYGQSKVMTERIVRAEDGGGVEWCLTRPTTVWGPGMSPHYQRFLALIRSGRYFHVGRRPLRKSYAYIGNISWQYARLLDAPAEAIHGRTFYLADYQPIDLIAWAEAFRAALDAPPIRTLPRALAFALARAGDVVNAAGLRGFPFNSFRLNNILTEYCFDLSETEKVCGPLPCSMAEGVRQTAAWFLSLDRTAAGQVVEPLQN